MSGTKAVGAYVRTRIGHVIRHCNLTRNRAHTPVEFTDRIKGVLSVEFKELRLEDVETLRVECLKWLEEVQVEYLEACIDVYDVTYMLVLTRGLYDIASALGLIQE